MMQKLPIIFLSLAISSQGDLLDGAGITHRRARPAAAADFQNQDNKRSLVQVADETCFDVVAESEKMWGFWSDLFGISSYPNNPVLIPQDFLDCPFKDLTPYYDCDETDCDFTALLNEMKGACELLGGNLFSITGSVTCLDGPQQGDTFTETNFPYCIPQGCEVDLSGIDDPLQFCLGAAESDYQVEQQPSPVSQDCRDGMIAIESKGLDINSIADFIFDDDITFDEDGVAYFGNITDQFLFLCEDAGGYLYAFSDKVTGNEVSYYFPDGKTIMYQPLCLASSCDAEVYFNDVFVPYQKYAVFDGMFPDPNGGDNCTYPVERRYEFLGYEAYSFLPSTAPSPSPPTATSGSKMISVKTSCISMVIAVSLVSIMFSI